MSAGGGVRGGRPRLSDRGRYSPSVIGGPDGGRTRDLVNAIHARSQLRHWPTLGGVSAHDHSTVPVRGRSTWSVGVWERTPEDALVVRRRIDVEKRPVVIDGDVGDLRFMRPHDRLHPGLERRLTQLTE